MTIQRWFSRAPLVLAIGALLSLAACSSAPGAPGGAYGISPTNTPTATVPAATATTAPTLTPPHCGPNFTNPTFYSTLPDATFKTTTVYAQVPLPPLTRAYDNDASGLRGRALCSAGTTASVLAFMTQHLTQLGWQQVSRNSTSCTSIDTYGQSQCWKNGTYALSLGINSSTDWIILFRDPDF